MYIQGVDSVYDLVWSIGPDGHTFTYGDVFLRNEQQYSAYNFEVADVDMLLGLFTTYEGECRRTLDAGYVLPAYDYVLKCSQTFNVLDARGAIGVTERQAFFARMRDLSRRVAEAYVDQRRRMELPWLEERESRIESRESDKASRDSTEAASVTTLDSPLSASFLLEIGTEELPAGDLGAALEQLHEKVPGLLDELGLSHGEIRVMGTPRRLVVSVAGLAGRQPDRAMVVKGPPAERAFDALGQTTRAGEGFARSKGVAVADLEVHEIDGGRYVVARVDEKGKPAVEVLASALPGLIAGLHFDKAMRWNSSGVAFSRPIRWLLAFFGSQVIPFEYAGYRSGAVTRGLRFHGADEIQLQDPAHYFRALQAEAVLLDPLLRKELIRLQVADLVAAAGGDNPVDPELLEEVNNLVEAPTALRGTFDAEHLQVLPPEVIISVMKKHQRYFPVKSGTRLLPYFIAVRNGDGQYLDVVTDGNEQVIRARFADASFFVKEDLKHPLADYLPRLDTLMYQKKLGSQLDKTHRIQRLVEALLPAFGLEAADAQAALRAAALCKADLVTKMVIEMTSLQGVMGRYYALHSGEPEAVAQAIYEHYLPRFAGEAAPASRAALLVGAADRLDTLAGLFAAGLAPTGTKDPFAQRRAALGLALNLIAWDLDFDLAAGLEEAGRGLPPGLAEASPESQAACLEFIAGRMRAALIDQGYRYDAVDASLAAQKRNPAGVGRAVKALSAWVSRTDWTTILPAYARCVRITRDPALSRYPVDPGLLAMPEEKALLATLLQAEGAPRRSGSVNDFLNAFLPMIPAINRFFETVLVMDENPALRQNRLGLLQRIAALAEGVADLALLEGF
jgi:glycyl-tRNA synthetase